MPKNSYAKARALRIPLLRSNSSDRLAWYRNALTSAAVFGCIVWLVAGHFPGRPPALNRYSPGPVSNAHAHLACLDCHKESVPLRDATFLSGWKNEADEIPRLWGRHSDSACIDCHHVVVANVELGSGQPSSISPHSLNQRMDNVGACAGCHQEHRGGKFLPSQVADLSCVACHARLPDFRIRQDTGIAGKIRRFEPDHPRFRSLEVDRGVLKFNHKLHLAAGLVDDNDSQISSKKLADYNDPQGLLARFENAAGEIQLDCIFCHQPTNEPVLASSLPLDNHGPLGTGQYMSMPGYERNCRVCHALQLEPDPRLAFDKRLQLQHGVSPEQVLNDLNVYFSLEAIAPEEIKQQLEKGDFRLPPSIPTQVWNSKAQTDVAESIRERVNKAANTARTACLRCHFASPEDSGRGVLLPRTMAADQENGITAGGMFETTILKHGKFDHAAHSDVKCTDCHDYENSLGKSQLTNLELDKPMIRDFDSCLACHQTAARVAPPNRPGPTNCISCHTYHGGGNRL